MERTDAEIVEATLSGTKEVFGELVIRYQGHIYGLAYSLLGNWDNAHFEFGSRIMIWNIAKKELFLNLLTLRFAVGTVLFLVLSVLFTWVLLDDYQAKLEDYDRLVSRNREEFRKLMTYQNLKPTIYKPPDILAIFSKGAGENLGNSSRVSIGEVPEIKSATASKNPLLVVFPILDIALIFKLVISVFASQIWENRDLYGKDVGFWSGDINNPRNNPQGRASLENAITDAKNRIKDEYINKIVSQITLGRNATRISPTVMYQCASEAIIGTGVARFPNLYNQLREYKDILKEFVIAMDSKDPNSLHLWVEPDYLRPLLLSRNPAEYSAIPRFEEIEPPVSAALRSATWDIGALALLNILLFMSVYISFLRSDVR